MVVETQTNITEEDKITLSEAQPFLETEVAYYDSGQYLLNSEKPPIEEYRYSSAAGEISYGELKKTEYGTSELFVDGTPLSSLVTGESYGRVQAALNLCETRGHSIWTEYPDERTTIYTEFKKLDDEGRTMVRIYKNPDTYTTELLQKQIEFFSRVAAADLLDRSLFEDYSVFSDFNLSSKETNGIYIEQANANFTSDKQEQKSYATNLEHRFEKLGLSDAEQSPIQKVNQEVVGKYETAKTLGNDIKPASGATIDTETEEDVPNNSGIYLKQYIN